MRLNAILKIKFKLDKNQVSIAFQFTLNVNLVDKKFKLDFFFNYQIHCTSFQIGSSECKKFKRSTRNLFLINV